ncbi:hypothetical protein FLONG3_1345 [Fusarium longipes]|uniref:Uncharacterized protein n=1 Tax=Fusarium longipes TaxID=694270 RepID=A0A395T766_9HYPO|nr:hypothetical protein FLONG3_1345 [Fusarium longipes]
MPSSYLGMVALRPIICSRVIPDIKNMPFSRILHFWQNRKPTVEEPVQQANPEAAIKDWVWIHPAKKPRRSSAENVVAESGPVDLDDTAQVPAKGFLDGHVNLPTYEPKNKVFQPFSPANYVLLTIEDVLSTMSKESHQARCILFETARLRRPILSVKSLKLSQDARVVDIQLINLDKALEQGSELIAGSWRKETQEKQELVLKGQPFQKILAAAKKSLRELEKTLNDQILDALKIGMQSKEDIDHKQIDAKVRNLISDLRKIYSKVTTSYYEEEKRVTGR